MGPSKIIKDYDPGYTPDKPDWCYSYIDVPNYDKMKTELLYLHNIPVNVQDNAYYANYSPADAKKFCPTLCDYLKDIGLYDKLYTVMLSSKSLLPGYPTQSRIHIDTLTKRYIHSINIPLVDCDNTYTAWYKGTVRLIDNTTNPYIGSNATPMMHFGVLDDDEATEICRAETSRPMLVNTSIPHRGIHNCPTRVLACIRFIPDLSDDEIYRITNYLKHMGVENPFL